MLYVNYRFKSLDNNQVATPINSEMVLILLIIICLYYCYFKVANHHELPVSYTSWPGNSLGEHNDDPNNGYFTGSMSPLVGHFIIEYYINNIVVVYRHKLIKLKIYQLIWNAKLDLI